MPLTKIRDAQLHSQTLTAVAEEISEARGNKASLKEAIGEGGGGGGASSEAVLELQREVAHLRAVTELKDRVDGASGFFYDLFDRTNKGSIAQLDAWEKEVDVLTAGSTSITIAGHDGPGIEAGMEITIQSNSDPDTFERVVVSSIIPEPDGVTYTLNLKGPVVNDYPDGALLYRSKGDSVEGKFIFAARRGEFGAKTYIPDILRWTPLSRHDIGVG